MAQTALEWFINGLLEANYITNDSIVINEFIEEAKAIEKRQIIKSHKDGFDHIVVDFKKDEFAEQYYNETYKK